MQSSPDAWFAYVQGRYDEYPEHMLEAVYSLVAEQLARMAEDDGDPAEWDVHHWQDVTPVVTEGLVQTTLGSPAVIYHGGLLHASVRHFDPANGRPGLPDAVGALVERIRPDGIILSLINTDPIEPREVVVQAGSFGEHRFVEARGIDQTAPATDGVPIGGRAMRIRLGPAAGVRLDVSMERFVNQPAYGLPFSCPIRPGGEL